MYQDGYFVLLNAVFLPPLPRRRHAKSILNPAQMQERHSISPYRATLSEDEVKRRFVPFLRDFYKNRYEPMPNSVAVELDNVSKEGWVADGKYTFRKSDGTPFVCTYEATSRDKADEVKFKRNHLYFHWDCAAFGSVCAALAYVFLFETKFKWLVESKFIGNLGMLLGIGIIGFLGWYFVMRNWRKYRYIYAIQQFKQYFADEQWVALAEDVFPSPNDPYLLELRNQCVYNGIGLAIVPQEGLVRKIIDPSRLGIFGKDRRMTQWVTRAQWYQIFSQNVTQMAANRPKTPDALTVMWNRIYRPFHYLVVDQFKRNFQKVMNRPLGQGASAYNRFMSGQSVQKWMILLAIFVVVPLFWNVMHFQETKVSDLELILRPNGINPEDQTGYLVDGEIIPPDGEPTGVPKQFPVAKNKKFAEEGNVINYSGDEDGYADPAPKTKVGPSKNPGKTTTDSDPCGRLRTKSGWFVQDNAFPDQDSARARAKALQALGVPAHWSPRSCISPNLPGWIVWLGDVHATEGGAQSAADNYVSLYQREGLTDGKFWVRSTQY